MSDNYPVFKMYLDVTTPEGKAEREKLRAHGDKPCYLDYGAGDPLGKMLINKPKS